MCTGHVDCRWSVNIHSALIYFYILSTVLKYNFKPLKTCKKIHVYYHFSTFLLGWTSFPFLSSHNHTCCIWLLIFSKLLFVCLQYFHLWCSLKKSHIWDSYSSVAEEPPWYSTKLFWRANVYSFVLMGTQHRKGVAYGVTLGPTNRITVTKASKRGVAT
jgi:hypothetical protein